MALVKASPAAIVLDRNAWKKESVRVAARAGMVWGGGMALSMGTLEWLSGTSPGQVGITVLAWLVAGGFYGLFMLPLMLLLLRPVQYVLPAAGKQDCDTMLAALHAALLKIRFELIGEQEDYRHYRFARRFALLVVQVRLLIFEDRLVVLGPSGAVRNALRKSKLWKRRK